MTSDWLAAVLPANQKLYLKIIVFQHGIFFVRGVLGAVGEHALMSIISADGLAQA